MPCSVWVEDVTEAALLTSLGTFTGVEKAMSRKERFLSKMMKNVLLPYEVSDEYEEEIIGEFENHYEKTYFQYFVTLMGPRAYILDLACGDGRHTFNFLCT